MGAYSIGVDLGGTNLRVAAIDSTGRILDRFSGLADYSTGPERVVTAIAKVVNEVRSRVSISGLRGVGLGVPGFIDIDAGVVVGAANLPGFQGFPVRDEIQKVLGTPIILE